MDSFSSQRHAGVTIFMVEGHPNLARLKEKFLEKRPYSLPFFLFFSYVLLCEIWFAREHSVNACGAAVSVMLCTGEAGQGCSRPGYRPRCGLRNRRSSFPRPGTQRKESGKCKHRAEHLRHVFFSAIKVACKPFYFTQQPTHLFIKYFLSSYYTRHLKGEKFLKIGTWSLQGRIRILFLLPSSHGYCENRHKNTWLEFSGFQEQCGHLGRNAQPDSSESEKVWQRGDELILA